MNKRIFSILFSIMGLCSCNEKEKKEMSNDYYFDIYAPNDSENKSGTTTDKKLIDFKQFETEFQNIDWNSYPANPTISVYNKSSTLWVALYATSQDAKKLKMFLIGHHYKKETKNIFGKTKEKEFSTTHFMVGNDKVLPLFELYFKDNNTERIIKKLKELDEQFKEETK